jgi:hypothetical protein
MGSPSFGWARLETSLSICFFGFLFEQDLIIHFYLWWVTYSYSMKLIQVEEPWWEIMGLRGYTSAMGEPACSYSSSDFLSFADAITWVIHALFFLININIQTSLYIYYKS